MKQINQCYKFASSYCLPSVVVLLYLFNVTCIIKNKKRKKEFFTVRVILFSHMAVD